MNAIFNSKIFSLKFFQCKKEWNTYLTSPDFYIFVRKLSTNSLRLPKIYLWEVLGLILLGADLPNFKITHYNMCNSYYGIIWLRYINRTNTVYKALNLLLNLFLIVWRSWRLVNCFLADLPRFNSRQSSNISCLFNFKEGRSSVNIHIKYSLI